MEQLDEICTESGATDVLEADERVWKIRRNCLESTRVLSLISTSDDLVVPVDKIAECIEHLNEVSKKYSFKLLCLAHAGDGNLHFQILKCDLSEEEFEKYKDAIKDPGKTAQRVPRRSLCLCLQPWRTPERRARHWRQEAARYGKIYRPCRNENDACY